MRLVTRVHAAYDWLRPASALIGVLLMELGDFAMMRRMLLGIEERAEAGSAHRGAGSSAPTEVEAPRREDGKRSM